MAEVFFPLKKHIHQTSKKFILKQILWSPKLDQHQNFAFLIICIHRNGFIFLFPQHCKVLSQRTLQTQNESRQEEKRLVQ